MRVFRRCRILLILLAGLAGIVPVLAFSPAEAETEAPTLAIIPLTVNAGEDLSYLAGGAADMLGSRIAANTGVLVLDRDRVTAALAGEDRAVTRARAEAVGESIGADYVLFGSITRLGRSFSLDVNIVDSAGEKAPAVFYQQVGVIDEIISAINSIAGEISRSVFAAPSEKSGADVPSATSAGTSAATSADPAASPYAHPETLLRGTRPTPSALVVSRAAGDSSFVKAEDDDTAGDFWKSQDLEMEIRGLAVADLSGDGNNEIVLLADNYLCVRRLEQGRFYKLAERTAARHEQFLSVDAVDTDGDGRAEIFVSVLNRNSRRLASFVLEFSQGSLIEVARKQEWFFRTMGEKDKIFGQKKGRPDAFLGDISGIFPSGIWRLEREGADYVQREKVPVPGDFSLFAVTRGRVRGSNSVDHIVADQNEKLRLYDDSGRLLWTGTEHFAGSETYLIAREESSNEISQRFYLPQRVLVTKTGAVGGARVITVAHTATGGRLFARFRRYSQSSFAGLAWDGLGLAEIWRTRPISGYIADFTLADLDNDGRRELIGGVVMSRGSAFSKPRSCVVRYSLDNIE